MIMSKDHIKKGHYGTPVLQSINDTGLTTTEKYAHVD